MPAVPTVLPARSATLRDVRRGQRDDRRQRPLDERRDRDQFQAFVAGEQQLGLVGDRHIDLAGRQQLQRFGGFGGDHRLDFKPRGAEVAGGQSGVERRVVGVGEPVEHHREGLGSSRGDRVLLGAAGGQGKGAGDGEHSGESDLQRRSPLDWLAHGARRRSTQGKGVEAGDREREQHDRGRVGARGLKRGEVGVDLVAQPGVGAGGGGLGLGDVGADHADGDGDPCAADRRGQRRGQLGEAEGLQARGVERAQQLQLVGVDGGEPVDGRDDDGEEADQDDHDQLGEQTEAQQEHEQRGDHRDRHRLGADRERIAGAAQGRREVDQHPEREPERQSERQPERDLLGGDGEVVREQPGVGPQRLRDRVGRREDRGAGRARVGVELPGAEQGEDEHECRQGVDEAAPHGVLPTRWPFRVHAPHSSCPAAAPKPSALRARSRNATTAASVRERGRGRSTSISARKRPGRGESTATRSASTMASSTSWVTSTTVRGSRCQGAAQPGLHLRARDRVERAERLVQAEDGLAGEQRAQERDALAHAAGELMRVGGLESAPTQARRTTLPPVRAPRRAVSRRCAARARRCRVRRATAAAGRAGASAPPGSTRRAPASGVCRPQISSSRVVLPQPLGPTTASSSPWSACSETPASACTDAPRWSR